MYFGLTPAGPAGGAISRCAGGCAEEHPEGLAGSAAVFGVPNEEWGEEVKAVLEPSPDIDGDEALAQEVLAFCEGKLARYKLPRSIDFTDRLPRSDNGKLYKRTLREPYWRHHAKRI